MAKQQSNNTVPLVETDGSGGHEPYVRLDATPVAGTPTLPSSALAGQETAVVDRQLLAAVQELTATLKEFMYFMVSQTGP